MYHQASLEQNLAQSAFPCQCEASAEVQRHSMAAAQAGCWFRRGSPPCRADDNDLEGCSKLGQRCHAQCLRRVEENAAKQQELLGGRIF
jgi:hypothetical protein